MSIRTDGLLNMPISVLIFLSPELDKPTKFAIPPLKALFKNELDFFSFSKTI